MPTSSLTPHSDQSEGGEPSRSTRTQSRGERSQHLKTPSSSSSSPASSGSHVKSANLPAASTSVSARSLVIGSGSGSGHGHSKRPVTVMRYAPLVTPDSKTESDGSNVRSIKGAVLALFGANGESDYTKLSSFELKNEDPTSHASHHQGAIAVTEDEPHDTQVHGHTHNHADVEGSGSEQRHTHGSRDVDLQDEGEPHSVDGDHDPVETSRYAQCLDQFSSAQSSALTTANAAGRVAGRMASTFGSAAESGHIAFSRFITSHFPPPEDPCDSCCWSAFHIICLNTDEGETQGEDADQLREYARSHGLVLKPQLGLHDLEGCQGHCCPESVWSYSMKGVRKAGCHG